MASGGPTASFDGTHWAPVSTSTQFTLVSCTSSSFCAGIVSKGGTYGTLGATDEAAIFNGVSWGAPTKVATGENGLVAVSCASSTFCVAVDNAANAYIYNGATWSAATSFNKSGSVIQDLVISCGSSTFCDVIEGEGVYTYNGTTWSAWQKVASSELSGLSCASASFCIAVTKHGATTFNGSTWTALAEIDKTGELTAVACSSTTNCAAVDNPGYAMTYNGTKWTSPERIDANRYRQFGVAGTSESVLTAVACNAAFCMTLDNSGRAFKYTSGGWTAAGVLGGGAPEVACSSPAFCVAVDQTGRALTFRSPTWSAPETIDGSTRLTSVSCVSEVFCMALDQNGTALRYNGEKWLVSAKIAAEGGPAIACASAAFCMGSTSGGVAKYNGSTWGAPTPVPGVAISCPSEAFCMAVGGTQTAVYREGSWGPATTLEHSGELEGVSCTSPTSCVAVDYAEKHTWRYDGTSWHELESPTANGLAWIACPATGECFAAGEFDEAWHLTAGTWTVQPTLSSIGGISGLACPTSTFCIAMDAAGDALLYGTPLTHEEAEKLRAEEEAAAKHKAEEEAAAKQTAEEAAAAKHKAEAESAAKHKAEEETAAKHKAEEETQKRKTEEEAAKRKSEEEAKPRVGVSRFKITAKAIAITVSCSTSGTVSVSGPGLKTTSKRCTGGAVTISVRLTASGITAKKHRKRIKIVIVLRTAHGSNTTTKLVKL